MFDEKKRTHKEITIVDEDQNNFAINWDSLVHVYWDSFVQKMAEFGIEVPEKFDDLSLAEQESIKAGVQIACTTFSSSITA